MVGEHLRCLFLPPLHIPVLFLVYFLFFSPSSPTVSFPFFLDNVHAAPERSKTVIQVDQGRQGVPSWLASQSCFTFSLSVFLSLSRVLTVLLGSVVLQMLG